MTPDLAVGLLLGAITGVACSELGLWLAEHLTRGPQLSERPSALPRRRW